MARGGSKPVKATNPIIPPSTDDKEKIKPKGTRF